MIEKLSAQEKILVALTEANARYADTRRSTVDIRQRRADMVGALLAAADAFPAFAIDSIPTAYPSSSSYRPYGYTPTPPYSQFSTNVFSGSDNVGSGVENYSLATSTMNYPT